MADTSGPTRRASTGTTPYQGGGLGAGLISGFMSRLSFGSLTGGEQSANIGSLDLAAGNTKKETTTTATTTSVGAAASGAASVGPAAVSTGPTRRASTGTSPMPSLLSTLTRSFNVSDIGPAKTSPGLATDSTDTGSGAAKPAAVDFSMYEQSGPKRLLAPPTAGISAADGEKMRRASTGTAPNNRRVSTMRNWFFNNSVPTIAEGTEPGKMGSSVGSSGQGSLSNALGGMSAAPPASAARPSNAAATGVIKSSSEGRRRRIVRERDLNQYAPVNF